jgi:hypothetical protein
MRLLLYGGLGNQLFKLFAASKLIEDGFATSVSIDVSWYEHKNPELAPNATYQLGNIIDGHQFTQTTIKSEAIFNLTNQIRAKLTSPQLKKLGIYTDAGEYVSPDFHPRAMVGNFENMSYFPTALKMMSLFDKLTVQNSWVLNVQSEIRRVNPIVLHVRLEDYLKYSDVYGIVNVEYYMKAVSYLRSKNPNSPIWLISDNPNLAIQRFRGLLDFDYVLEQPMEVSPLQFLTGVSSTNKIVIANSTFSWWAAWLAHQRNAEVQVVMPSRFHSHECDINRLYISGWKRISV